MNIEAPNLEMSLACRELIAGHDQSDQGSLCGKRLAFFTSVVGMGGSEVLVADAMEAACEQGADVVCWCHQDAAIRSIVARRRGMAVRFVDWPAHCSSKQEVFVKEQTSQGCVKPSLRNLVRSAIPAQLRQFAGFRRDARQFYRQLEIESPDLLFVNVNGSEAVSLAGGWWSRERTINCYHLSVTPSRGATDWLARRQTVHAAAMTIHTSMAVRNQWCSAFGYPVEKTRVIYNGVDERKYADRDGTRAELGIGSEEFVFCVPGRLDPIKGHRYLLEAVASDNQTSAYRVLIAGEGELRNELERYCQVNGIAGKVVFLGFRNDLPDVLRACDCTVLPSIASENLSVAVLESLMAATPAIVTHVGGMAEAIDNGKNGIVVPPANVAKLRDAMHRIAVDRGAAIQMRISAQKSAGERFTRRRMMDEYISVFRDVLECANLGAHRRSAVAPC